VNVEAHGSGILPAYRILSAEFPMGAMPATLVE
jgi:hypothetical protein